MSTNAKVFYAGNKETNITVDKYDCKKMGETLDGDPVYHHVYIKLDNTHVSYDTVLYNGSHRYIWGSGHETRNNQVVGRWDGWMTNEINWRHAIQRRTTDVINTQNG